MDLTLLSAGIDATEARTGANLWNQSLDAMVERTETSMGKIKGALGKISSEIFSLSTLIGGISFAGLVKDIMSASQDMDKIRNVLQVTTESAAMAAVQFNELRKMAYQYGQNLPTLARGYSLMAESAKGTSLAGQGVDKIFRALIQSGTALSLSQEQMQRIFYAVDHMMSKQIVTTQDLRRQLGNNLPGAINLSAKAMGVSVLEFNKMLKTGQVLAKDLLPKLADVLSKEYGGAAEKAGKQTRGLVATLGTALFELKVWIANSGLGSAVDDMLRKLIAVLKSDQLKEAAQYFAKYLAIGVDVAARSLVFLLGHAKSVLFTLGAFAALKTGIFFSSLAGQVLKAKDALMEFETVQRAVLVLQSPGKSLFSGGSVAATSSLGGLLQGKTGLLSQNQLNSRLAGSTGRAALNSVSSYEKVRFAKMAEEAGLVVPLSALTQYKAAATAPLRMGSAAWRGVRSGASSVGGIAIGAFGVAGSVINGFRNPGQIEQQKSAQLIESMYSKKLPPALSNLVSGPSLNVKATTADIQALNFILDKNGEILSKGALNSRLAGQAFKGLSAEAKAALTGMTNALGYTIPATATFAQSAVGGFKGIGAASSSVWVAMRSGFMSAWGAIATALAANPFTLLFGSILLAIATVSVALYALRDHTLTIGGHTAKVGSYIGVVWDSVASKFKDVWGVTADWFKGIWGGVTSWFDKLSDSPMWKRMESILSKFTMFKDWAKAAEQREADVKKYGGVVDGSVTGARRVADYGSKKNSINDVVNSMYGDLPRRLADQPIGPENKPTPSDAMGAEVKPKADPYKTTVDLLRAQIAEYRGVLAMEDASKHNLIEINALYEAQKKIIELQKSNKLKLTGGQQSEIKSLYLQAAKGKDAAAAKTTYSELLGKTEGDSGYLKEQLEYIRSLTSASYDYKNGIEGFKAALEAYDKTESLEGRVSEASLQTLREKIKQNIIYKNSIQNLTSAYTEFYTGNEKSVAAIKDNENLIASLTASGRASGKRGYQTFSDQSGAVNARANIFADNTIGKDKKDLLSPTEYSTRKTNLIKEYTTGEQAKYTQDLINFAEEAKRAQGDTEGLSFQINKLNDAYKHGFLSSGQMAQSIRDIQMQWDRSIDEQLIRGNTWQNGVLVGMREIARQGQETANIFATAFSDAFKSVQDRLVSFLDTGKLSFKGFGKELQHAMNEILVTKVSGSLMNKLLGPGAGNTLGGGNVGNTGPVGMIAKFLGAGGGGSGPLGTSGRSPAGVANDPIYVALTTGGKSDFSGLPRKLGGAANDLATTATSSIPSTVTSALSKVPGFKQIADGASSLADSSVVQGALKMFGSTGYAGLASMGDNTSGSQVSSAFIKSFLGSMFSNSGPGMAGLSSVFSMIADTAGTVSTVPSELTSLLSFANGGVMTSGGIQRYSKGGIANRPQLAQFGEGRTPEAYVPLPDGRSIPVSMTGSGNTGGAIQHTTNIYDQTGRGVKTTQSESTSNDGKHYVQEIWLHDLQTEGPMSQSLRSYMGGR